MKFYFLPALGAQSSLWMPGGKLSRQLLGRSSFVRVQKISKKELLKSGFPKDYHISNWMDDEVRGTPAYHPHLLISYYWLRHRALAFPDDSYVFGDSGGFSVLRKGLLGSTWRTDPGAAPHQKRIDPEDVLRWQADICTVGCILDVPPVTPAGTPILIEVPTKTKNHLPLPTTLRNMRSALPLYKELLAQGTKFRWWGVAHGWTEKQLDIWWSAVSDVYPFTEEGEGWCIRARPVSFDPVAIARCLHWFKKHEIRRAHFLAAAGPAAIATILVLGERIGLQSASSDSKAALDFARNRKAFTLKEDGLGYDYIAEAGAGREVRDYFLNDCQCFSCVELAKDVTVFPEIATCAYEGKFSKYWFHRFLFHNYLVAMQFVRNIKDGAVKDPDRLLLHMLGKTRYSNILRAMEGHEGQTSQGFVRTLMDFV